MGYQRRVHGESIPKIHWKQTSVMFRLAFVIAVAVAAPLEDTAEVAAAKEEFQALFDAAVAGDHAALAPVNNDVQADQIANSYLDDAEDVAEAKAKFTAAFEDAAAGGLAALQAPAPVHEVAEVEPVAVAAPAPVAPVAFPHIAYNRVLPAAPYLAGYPYNGIAYNGLAYNGLAYNGLVYNGLVNGLHVKVE